MTTSTTRITEDINPILSSPQTGPADHVQTRQLDPRSSLEDYNRVMLAYTQRRMSTFTDVDDGCGSPKSRSSRGSQSSVDSGGSGSPAATSTSNPAPTPLPRSHKGSETLFEQDES